MLLCLIEILDPPRSLRQICDPRPLEDWLPGSRQVSVEIWSLKIPQIHMETNGWSNLVIDHLFIIY
jgi:hypothetical protein